MSSILPLPLIDLDTDIKLVSLRATILRLDALVEARVVGDDLTGPVSALAGALKREVRRLEVATPKPEADRLTD